MLFRNASVDAVWRVLRALRPDVLQFHGEEAPEFCSGFGLPYWRAVPMKTTPDVDHWQRRYASAEALLLDSHGEGESGGQGRTFDWRTVPVNVKTRLILAGGLTPENVAEAVRLVRPYAVDVSSGIESAPGVKDHGRMQRFIEQVRYADGA
ncbi:MAG: phosphoribosylanthranilate isomerase [Nevskiales bacterium]|nr:phosphoribosylanthranilate isomerase [Nevskiales bacterium]